MKVYILLQIELYLCSSYYFLLWLLFQFSPTRLSYWNKNHYFGICRVELIHFWPGSKQPPGCVILSLFTYTPSRRSRSRSEESGTWACVTFPPRSSGKPPHVVRGGSTGGYVCLYWNMPTVFDRPRRRPCWPLVWVLTGGISTPWSLLRDGLAL